MGRLYKRGKVWWVQYYRRGELFRESSRSPLKSIAAALLKIREGDAAAGRMPTLHAEKTAFEDLVKLHGRIWRSTTRKPGGPIII